MPTPPVAWRVLGVPAVPHLTGKPTTQRSQQEGEGRSSQTLGGGGLPVVDLAAEPRQWTLKCHGGALLQPTF